MHVEEPHRAPHSVSEFVRSYAMIVLSILTALALERVAVTWQARAAARESRVRIEAELKADLTDLQKAIDFNQANIDADNKVAKAAFAELQAAKPDRAKLTALFDDAFKTNFGLQMPTWQRDAWEGAIADQSAGHLDPADLRYYTSVYSDGRDLEQGWQFVLNGNLFDRLSDLIVDRRLGQVDGVAALKVLVRFVVSAQQINGNLKHLADEARARAAP